MAKVEGVPKLLAALRAREKAAKEANVSVVVGYSASYAIHVHENLEARHTNGSAKFLEIPFRELRDVFREIVRQALAAGKGMAQGLLLAGLRLQREAMALTPVDTGALRASAFVRLEE